MKSSSCHKKISSWRLVLDTKVDCFHCCMDSHSRGHNHVVLHEEDLILMYCIINKIKVNWPYVIAEQIEKAKRLPDYRLPYVVLISKFLQNFLIPLEGELEEPVKQTCEISKSTINNIGLTQDNNGIWITQGEAKNEEQAEEAAGEDAGPAEHEAAGGEVDKALDIPDLSK